MILTGRFGGTPSWTVVDDFANYMVNNGIAKIKWSSTEAKVGDIIQFYNEARGGWYHSGIVSKFDTTYGLCYGSSRVCQEFCVFSLAHHILR